jgi:hypothetical protein
MEIVPNCGSSGSLDARHAVCRYAHPKLPKIEKRLRKHLEKTRVQRRRLLEEVLAELTG